ncbi:hypothetical protein [Cellulomonas soli]|uniref:DUF4232 domain-containing protein n=1 Tax=Cellulomonas soli TaxID=931535 RepID=A0A512PFA6_9CELL|nr:hypothetical protein [Cellulomonas soli]NYI59321.1 hypothetical protein [Cellulomonas soli]GEP69891.1 hypothetical protein CSO01_26060 [Cellulomonas soli]
MNVVRPKGPLPARVYWVRRAVVLGIPLLVLGLVVWLVAGRGGADDQATPAASTPAASDAAAAQDAGADAAGDEGSGVTTCPAAGLTVTIAATAPTFAEGSDPTFDLTITNTGTAPCLVDAGTSQSEVLITSGSDRIWSSRDCAAADAATNELLIDAGKSHQQQLGWDRTRSAEGCPADLPAPGDGTYTATLSVQGATSEATVFGLG